MIGLNSTVVSSSISDFVTQHLIAEAVIIITSSSPLTLPALLASTPSSVPEGPASRADRGPLPLLALVQIRCNVPVPTLSGHRHRRPSVDIVDRDVGASLRHEELDHGQKTPISGSTSQPGWGIHGAVQPPSLPR